MKTTDLSRHGFSIIDYPPCNAWADNADYKATPKILADLSIENFKTHAPGANDTHDIGNRAAFP